MTQDTWTDGSMWVLLHPQSWEMYVRGLKVPRIGLGVRKIPNAAVFLKSLWGLFPSEMDSAKAGR